jgi:hypothetical protein
MVSEAKSSQDDPPVRKGNSSPVHTADSAHSRPKARLLAVLGVLFGLFLMHGNPAMAMGGCHGALSASADRLAPMDRQVSAVALAPSGQSGERAASLPSTVGDLPSGMGGALCVSTPPQGGPVLPHLKLAALFLILVTALALCRLAGPAGFRRRGPPEHGRDLLQLVCVART